MKIGESLGAFMNRITLRDEERSTTSSAPAFQQAMQAESDRLRQEVLQQSLRDIERQGARLAERCQLNDLLRYKALIREFLSEIVRHGYAMKDERSRDRGGRTRLYRLVAQVDAVLSELASQIVSTEKDHLSLLEKIGEIHGLLINLYF